MLIRHVIACMASTHSNKVIITLYILVKHYSILNTSQSVHACSTSSIGILNILKVLSYAYAE